jgi:thiamine kinase-like enzyme
MVTKFYAKPEQNFKFDAIAYMTLSESGVCPKLIEVTGNYRAVELVNARELTQLDLMNPCIMKTNIEALCDFNYNEVLKSQWEKHFGDQTYIKRLWMEGQWIDGLTKLREFQNWEVFLPENKRVAKIQEFYDKILKDKANIQTEPMECYPKAEKEWDMVISHNDYHSMNLLLDNSDYNKTYILDFELTSPNIRGWDLSYHLYWTMFNMRSPPMLYQLNYNFFPTDQEIDEYIKIYLTRFHTKYYPRFGGD